MKKKKEIKKRKTGGNGQQKGIRQQKKVTRGDFKPQNRRSN
jgi:hypothetical protein